MTVKFWKGILSSDSMQAEKEAWFDEWLKTAKEAKAENKELIVFEVPKKQDGSTDFKFIKAIETYLQTEIEE
jgi:hypothetical protein